MTSRDLNALNVVTLRLQSISNMEFKQVDLAWAAGIIDGDGCITMDKTYAKSSYRRPCVYVDNTDYELIEELMGLFSGYVVSKKKYKGSVRLLLSSGAYSHLGE